jgi:p24 family protein delta-1
MGRLMPIVMLATLVLAVPLASAYEFDMVFQTKCIFEEVELDLSIKGHYNAFHKDDDHHMVPVNIRIEDPNGEVVFQEQNSNEADFQIPSTIEGEYKICFTAKGKSLRYAYTNWFFLVVLHMTQLSSAPKHFHPFLCFCDTDYHTAQSTRIRMKWREGADATDWEAVAKRDNLDAIHTEMLRLEDYLHHIHVELQHIRRKEEKMRDINELTNARVAWFSIGALLTCVGMAALQLWNLRRFFIRKKLL